MNAIFNWKRFGMLVKSDWQLHWKQNLLGFAAVFVGMFLFLLLSMPSPWKVEGIPDSNYYKVSEDSWFPYIMLMFAIYIIIILLTSFNALANKSTRARFLLLPASMVEKFVYQTLTYILFMGIMLYLIFWADAQLIRAVLIDYYNLSDEMIAVFVPYRLTTPFMFSEGGWEAVSMGCIVIGLACYALNANIWFRKLGWLKMVILLGLIFYAFGIMMVGFSHIFYPEHTVGFDTHIPNVVLPGTSTSVFQVYIYGIANIAWIMLLAIAFFKFKETEL